MPDVRLKIPDFMSSSSDGGNTQPFKDMMDEMSEEDVFGLISDMSKMEQQEFMETLARKGVAPKHRQQDDRIDEPVCRRIWRTGRA